MKSNSFYMADGWDRSISEDALTLSGCSAQGMSSNVYKKAKPINYSDIEAASANIDTLSSCINTLSTCASDCCVSAAEVGNALKSVGKYLKEYKYSIPRLKRSDLKTLG